MSKVSVTYKAPQGDSKVCEMFGHTFFDGKPVEIEVNEANAYALKKLANNSLFEITGSVEGWTGSGETQADAGTHHSTHHASHAQAEDDDDKGKGKKGR